ncbi:DHA2 family efflux MFS transporter permease subunit [uncultured Rhodoblastus sp.]|uniref:DHA2 family efflux MFS transporter permease subunit n=1 Tax=uncultured Rhodoblastus sp. TaxID=543037 RepID=UPI0025F92BA2|nr:DHA2 family efflux MFS transporter permease subunit [uncultured Rhodoblastus sp.]
MRPFILTPLIVACALFMEQLDSTIVATSLPAIAADLHQDPIALKLSMTSYMLAQAVFIPASGWVADRYGARTVFRAAIVVFTLGSILCGLSSSLPQFVAARIFQGCGGAMMAPVGRLVLFRSVERSEIVRAMAYLTIPALVGPMLGPPLGGFISTYLNWRWNFWINVPFGLLGVVLATLYVQDAREENIGAFDAKGFLLTGLGLSSLIFGLTVLGRGFIGHDLNLGLILFGVVCTSFYIFHALRVENPILDLRLLAIDSFRASVVGGFLFRVGVGATPFLLPLMLQLGFGMTPFQSGLTTFVATAGALVMKASAASALQRFGFKNTLVFNCLISAAFLAANGLFRPDTPQALMLLTLFVGGFFRSLQFTALNALAYADIDHAAMSKATSFAAVAQQLSLSSGVAIAAAVVEQTRGRSIDARIGALDFPPAFFVVAAITAASALVFMRLPPDAGAALSGQGRQQAE